MSLFINKNDTFDITFAVAFKDNHMYVGDNEEQIKTQKNDVENIKVYKITFRTPTYNDSTKILNSSVNVNGDNITINPAEVRKARVITLLHSWDLTDDNGVPVEPSLENINQLHPNIATVIMNKLDRALQDRNLL